MTLYQFCARSLFVLFALGVVSCVTALAASGDVGNPLLETSKPLGDRLDRSWKRYRNDNLGYCVSYPSRWYRGSAFDGSGLFVETGVKRYSKPVGEIDIGPVNFDNSEDARLKPDTAPADTLDQDLQEHLLGLRKFARAERLEIIDQHPLKLQGFKGLYVKNSYYDPLERTSWMQELVFVKRKGELYRLELQCKPDQISRFEPVFAHLVNTFEFDCK